VAFRVAPSTKAGALWAVSLFEAANSFDGAKGVRLSPTLNSVRKLTVNKRPYASVGLLSALAASLSVAGGCASRTATRPLPPAVGAVGAQTNSSVVQSPITRADLNPALSEKQKERMLRIKNSE